MTVHGICLDNFRTGHMVQFRRPARIERNYSKFLRPEFGLEDLITFVVGVSSVEWLEAEMRRRVYRPMIQTRFDPARLPT